LSKKLKIILIASLIGNLAIVYVAIKALEYRAHINEFKDKYDHVVSEFSQRDTYRSDNESLVSDQIIKNRIVFFGTQTVQTWPLEKYFTNYETINRGIFGQRVSGMLLRIYPDLIDLHPEYGLIEISSYNFRPENSVDEIIDYSRSMLALALHNNIKPIACTIIPPCRDSVDLGDYNLTDSISRYNNWLKEYCDTDAILLGDLNQALSDSAGFLKISYSSGPIDLNSSGYSIISALVDSIISNQTD